MLLDQSVICPDFIGRTHHLGTLRRLLERVGNGGGAPRAALIAGEAGIGKSRLVAQVKHIAASENWLILHGNCFEPDRTLPYAPLLDLLRVFCAEHSLDEVLRDLGPKPHARSRLIRLAASPRLAMVDVPLPATSFCYLSVMNSTRSAAASISRMS